MKTITALLFAWLAMPLFAQTILTPYYVVPPTGNCDGLAAFGPASAIWTAPCTAPFLYMAAPDGCAQGTAPFGPVLWFSGDTIYTHLCAMPCAISIQDASGECVILCQLPGAMSVASAGAGQLFSMRPNPLAVGSPLQVTFSMAGPVMLTLLDAQGRVVQRSQATSPTANLDVSHLRAGLHLLHAQWPDGRTSTQRLLVQ